MLTYTLRTFYSLMAIVLLLLLFLWATINYSFVNSLVCNFIGKTLSKQTEKQISIGGFKLFQPYTLQLDDVFVEDELGDTLAEFKELEVNISLTSLLNNQLNFDYLYLREANSKIIFYDQTNSFNFQYWIDAFASENPEPKTPSSWTIGLNDLTAEFENVQFLFKDEKTKISTLQKIKHLTLTTDSVNLDALTFEAETTIEGLFSEVKTADLYLDLHVPNLTFNHGYANINTINYGCKSLNATLKSYNMTLGDSTFTIRNVEIISSNNQYSPSHTQSKIQKLAGNVNNLLTLENLTGYFELEEKKIVAQDFTIEANEQEVSGDIELHFPSLLKIIDINNIGLKQCDIDAQVSPHRLNQYIPKNILEQIKNINTVDLAISTSGNTQNLKIKELELSTNNKSSLLLNGEASGINHLILDSIKTCFNVPHLVVQKKDIQYFIKDIPYHIPQNINSSFNFCGSIYDFKSEVNLNSNYGDFKIEATSHQKKLLSQFNFKKVDISPFINDSTLRPFYLQGNLELEDFTNTQNIIGKSIIQVDSFKFKGHQYNKLAIELTLEDKNHQIHASHKDSSFNFNLLSQLNIRAENSISNSKITINTLNLKELGFLTDTVVLSGNYTLDVLLNKDNSLSAGLYAKNINVIYNSIKKTIPDLTSHIKLNENKTTLKLNSEALSVDFYSNIALDSIPNKLAAFTNSYLTGDSSLFLDDTLNASLVIKDNDLLFDSIPLPVEKLTFDRVDFNYIGNKKTMDFNMKIPEVYRKDIGANNILLRINTTNKKLEYTINADKISLLDSLKLYKPTFKGFLGNDQVSFDYSIKDSIGNYWYLFGGDIVEKENIYILSLDSLLLINYKNWSITQDSSEHKLNYRITHKDEALNVSTQKDQIDLTFKNIQLEDFFIREKDFNIQLSGNGFINHKDSYKYGIDLLADSFYVDKNELGTLKLKASGSPKKHSGAIEIKEQGNDIEISGFYAPDSIDKIEIIADIKRYQPYVLNKLLGEYFTNIDGALSGHGSFKSKQNGEFTTEGALKFDNFGFKSRQLNTTFTFKGGQVKYVNGLATVDQVIILDSLNNQAIFDGNIKKNEVKEYYNFNLTGKIDRFLAMDSKAEKNKNYYGKLLLSSNISLKGTSKLPILSTNFSILNETNLTYISNDNGLNDASSFDDVLSFSSDSIVEQQEDSLNLSFMGLDLETAINVHKNAKFKVVVDPVTGDYLSIIGGGKIEAKIPSNGIASFHGKYTIESGLYNMTLYELVKKSFNIKKGSSLTWFGNPENPALDLTATYDTEASPYPLVAAETNEATKHIYQASRKFRLHMIITGTLDSPILNFKIEYMDEDNTGKYLIIQKLNEINSSLEELNKQVFSVLLLNSFVSPDQKTNETNVVNPFESLSQMVSGQLNNMSKKYIKNVDIDWDLSSKQVTGNKGDNYTQNTLGVSVKKQLLDDRIMFEVGSGVEYKNQESQNTSSYFGNASVELSITEDGRFKLRVFSKNDNNYLGERIISNGVSVIYTKEYEKFGDLLKKDSSSTK